MTPERYKKLTDWLEGHPALREGIILLNRWLPLVPFVCYPVLLVLLNLRWFTMLTIGDRKSTRLNSSHSRKARMPSSA